MGSLKAHAIATILGSALGALSSAYMLYLRVPSVIEVRPELADVSFVTGLFSGRAETYLFYNYPGVMVAITLLFTIVVFNFFALEKGV